MAKNSNKNKWLFGFFIIFLMISSTIGFMYSSDSSSRKVNGVKFVQNNGVWRAYIDSIESYWDFNYLPDEIGFDVNSINLNEQTIYVYPNSQADKKYIDKLKFILLYRGISVEEADEKNCSEEMYILSSTLTSDIKISYEDKCILINGNINKFIDGLTYKVFGVL